MPAPAARLRGRGGRDRCRVARRARPEGRLRPGSPLGGRPESRIAHLDPGQPFVSLGSQRHGLCCCHRDRDREPSPSTLGARDRRGRGALARVPARALPARRRRGGARRGRAGRPLRVRRAARRPARGPGAGGLSPDRAAAAAANPSATTSAAPSAMRAALSPDSANDAEKPYPTAVKVAAQSRAPARLQGTKRRRPRPEAPARKGETARTMPVNRPSSTALPP